MTPPAKLTERALVLALTAFLAWVPPLVGIFSLSWAVFIALCARITRKLRQSAQQAEDI